MRVLQHRIPNQRYKSSITTTEEAGVSLLKNWVSQILFYNGAIHPESQEIQNVVQVISGKPDIQQVAFLCFLPSSAYRSFQKFLVLAEWILVFESPQ